MHAVGREHAAVRVHAVGREHAPYRVYPEHAASRRKRLHDVRAAAEEAADAWLMCFVVVDRLPGEECLPSDVHERSADGSETRAR